MGTPREEGGIVTEGKGAETIKLNKRGGGLIGHERAKLIQRENEEPERPCDEIGSRDISHELEIMTGMRQLYH